MNPVYPPVQCHPPLPPSASSLAGLGTTPPGLSLLSFRWPQPETVQTCVPRAPHVLPLLQGMALPSLLVTEASGDGGLRRQAGSVGIAPRTMGLAIWVMWGLVISDGRVCKRQGEQGLGLVA